MLFALSVNPGMWFAEKKCYHMLKNVFISAFISLIPSRQQNRTWLLSEGQFKQPYSHWYLTLMPASNHCCNLGSNKQKTPDLLPFPVAFIIVMHCMEISNLGELPINFQCVWNNVNPPWKNHCQIEISRSLIRWSILQKKPLDIIKSIFQLFWFGFFP